MTDPKGTSKILGYAKQMQQALAKKPVSTVMLDNITGEVSDKSLLPRLRANTVKYVSDEAYLNIPELTKGLEASKEQIKRLFVGKKENLAGLVGQIMTQTSKLLSQTKKSSASLDKVAKKAGNADGVNDKKGVDEILAAAKAIVTACNLLVKDYTRTVAECKIGINTLLNGVTKLVGKTISKEDGTGFEEDFEPEEDAKTGFKKDTSVPVKRPGAPGSTTMPKLGAGRQRMGTGNKMSSFKDTKGYTKDVIAEVEAEHLSAKELAKRQAVVKKGANRNKK
jgi:glutaredoxin 2